MSFDMHHGDCLEILRTLPDNSIDSIVTDPPYGLSFMGKKWDYDVPGTDVWIECLRVLKPGGHLLAFGGSRTYHRMVCAIEDAGWEIRDCIMWLYGSGFPKSKNGTWGGTALKPAHETIVVARKPLIGTIAANVQEFGTGALNIDACRVPLGDGEENPSIARYESTQQVGSNGWIHVNRGANFDEAAKQSAALGRWPANVIHDGSDEVLAFFPVRRADAGSAARFFYCTKASKSDRNEGCENITEKQYSNDGRKIPIDNAYQRNSSNSSNSHPTVKPTNLMRYLCRLVTPPGGVVLDPFMGSGSTGKAAILEGFHFIGIEREAEYVEISRARIENAESKRDQQADLFGGQAA